VVSSVGCPEYSRFRFYRHSWAHLTHLGFGSSTDGIDGPTTQNNFFRCSVVAPSEDPGFHAKGEDLTDESKERINGPDSSLLASRPLRVRSGGRRVMGPHKQTSRPCENVGCSGLCHGRVECCHAIRRPCSQISLDRTEARTSRPTQSKSRRT
jgi:hypothetical protein